MNARRTALRVLVFAPGLIPSAVIGVLRPLVELEKRGEVILRLRYASVRAGAANDIAWCDVGVFCRSCEIMDLEYLYELKRSNKCVIYEIDDNFEEIPLNTPISLYHRKFSRLHALKRFFAMADLTRVYSQRLRERAEAHGANVWVVRSYFDSALINQLSPPTRGDKIKIAYPTGRIDDPRLEHIFFDALQQILDRYRDKVEIHFWKKKIPAQMAGIEGVILNKPVASYEAFVRSFYSGAFDIGLAPLVDEPFFHSKSNNKYREFGGCGIAGVYSDMPPYAGSIVEGKTGLLVANTAQAWVKGIERLILNADLRREIAANSKADVELNYNFENAVESFRLSLNDVVNRPPRICDWLFPERLRLDCAIVGPRAELRESNATANADRQESFSQALAAINGREVLRMGYADALEKAQAIASCNAVLYLIDSINDLQQAAISFPLFHSVILDLSQLKASEEEVRQAFSTLSIFNPVSLVLNRDQGFLIALVQEMGGRYVLVNDHVTPLDNEYSLAGYKAAYADIIEQHHRYGKAIKVSRCQAALKSAARRVSERWYFYSGRAHRAWLLLQWRLGRRPL